MLHISIKRQAEQSLAYRCFWPTLPPNCFCFALFDQLKIHVRDSALGAAHLSFRTKTLPTPPLSLCVSVSLYLSFHISGDLLKR